MSNVNKIIIAVIGVVVIAGAVWLLTSNKTAESPSAPNNQSSEKSNETTATTTFTYTDAGFNPSTATIKASQTVKVVNNSQKEIKFASNPHPAHTDNPELNTNDLEAGDSTTFTVTKKGTWGFHNHYDPSQGGTLTVE
jgi:plastocyanin